MLIGHDWGAVATYIVAGAPQPAFARAVALSIPPLASFVDPGALRTAPLTVLRQLRAELLHGLPRCRRPARRALAAAARSLAVAPVVAGL